MQQTHNMIKITLWKRASALRLMCTTAECGRHRSHRSELAGAARSVEQAQQLSVSSLKPGIPLKPKRGGLAIIDLKDFFVQEGLHGRRREGQDSALQSSQVLGVKELLTREE